MTEGPGEGGGGGAAKKARERRKDAREGRAGGRLGGGKMERLSYETQRQPPRSPPAPQSPHLTGRDDLTLFFPFRPNGSNKRVTRRVTPDTRSPTATRSNSALPRSIARRAVKRIAVIGPVLFQPSRPHFRPTRMRSAISPAPPLISHALPRASAGWENGGPRARDDIA